MRPLYLAGPIALLIALFVFGEARQLPGQTAGQTLIRIAYVSARRVVAESAQGRAGTARLQAEQQERAASLRMRQQELESARREIVRTADGAAAAKLQQRIQQQQIELAQATIQAQNDLQALQREIQNALDEEIKPIIEEVAKEQGIDLVLTADSTVLYGASSLDLTPAVLARLARP